MNNTRSSFFIAACLVFSFTYIVSSVNTVWAQDFVQIKGPKDNTDQYSGTVYGPITPDDTLWQIAQRYRQNRRLSVFQVMAAVYDLNPNSFEQQNLNLLIDGSMLRLPSERYVATFDANDARARAQRDEQSWTKIASKPGVTVRNIKPSSPAVNRDDLVSTKNELEQRLTSLNDNQTRQFDELREQFAQSISSVESLLEDNKKLYERIDKVDGDIDSLRSQVEGNVQSTMDAQSQSIDEMLSLMKQEQQIRQQEASSSFLKKLSDPIVIIIVSSIFTLSLLGFFGYWLLTRNRKTEKAKKPAQTKETTTGNGAADAAVVSEVNALIDEPNEDSNEISEDDLFNDDDLLDDVLSNELEESLDNELDNFSSLDDEMLVPEEQSLDDVFEEGDSQLAQDDLDALFSEPAEPEEADGFDISGDDDSQQAKAQDTQDTSITEDYEENIDDFAPAEPNIEKSEEDVSSESNDDEKVEDRADALDDTDIDDVLEHTSVVPDIASELGLEGDELSEGSLEKIDDEINQQNQKIDSVTDNIINEIEQLEMMGDMLDGLDDDDDDDEDELSDALTDDLLDELTSNLDLDEENDSTSDSLTEDLLEELSGKLEEEPAYDLDDLSEELVNELEQNSELEQDSEVESVETEDEHQQSINDIDDVSEALLNELDELGSYTENTDDGENNDVLEHNEIEDLDDVPDLDDWLSEDDASSDSAILDELENTDFDELLHSIDEGEQESLETDVADTDKNSESLTDQPKPMLDNPDLDLDALFAEVPDTEQSVDVDDLISVDDLLEEADATENNGPDEEFDLDVSLSEFTGEKNDEDLIDVDTDSGQAANLDLAQAYLEMDDGPASRELLLEVLEKGTDEQKVEAQTLLDELGSA